MEERDRGKVQCSSEGKTSWDLALEEGEQGWPQTGHKGILH